MLDFFLRYKKIILRFLGALLLIVGFAVYFWNQPKEGFSKSEFAAANVARMEASVSGQSSRSNRATKPNDAPFFKELKSTKEKQMQYLTILVMIVGAGFLGYSFIKK